MAGIQQRVNEFEGGADPLPLGQSTFQTSDCFQKIYVAVSGPGPVTWRTAKHAVN